MEEEIVSDIDDIKKYEPKNTNKPEPEDNKMYYIPIAKKDVNLDNLSEYLDDIQKSIIKDFGSIKDNRNTH